MAQPTNTFYRDPSRGFRQWHRDEIVTENGNGKWVPNPNDLVVDYEQGFFIVTEVDYTTGLSVLTPWVLPESPEEDDNIDVLIGSGPGYPSESYRAFLDTTVTPHTLSPDLRLHYYSSSIASYRVFLGTDISQEHGTVISSFYDNAGNFLGDSIPVEGLANPDTDGEPVKAPMTGYTSEKLDDGELVTVVAYDDSGGVVSEAKLLIQNTKAIRRADASKRYIQSIQLESPFISDADPQVIEFPLNVTVESLPLTGVVNYSDGKKQRLPIDNTRFSLMGLRNYIATETGQQFPMVLAYTLSPDEVSYTLTPTANRRLTLPYTAMTTPVDGAYGVKLFVYPVWVDAVTGYRLEFWLYNLDRQTFYNVTPNIELGVNSAPFNPTLYGATQNLTYAVNLNNVDGKFVPYRHVQNIQLALLARGDQDQDNWVIYPTPGSGNGYGRGYYADLEFVSANSWNLKLDQGLPSKEVWLKTLYDSIEPLVHPDIESVPPVPTHFRVRFLNNTYEYTVDQWDETFVVNNDLEDGELVYIQWIRRNYDTDLQLGISALPVRSTGS